MQNKKIAIYSNEIPSSTFIERLINGLAKDNTVFLFGYLKNKQKYNSKNIKVIAYKNRLDKIFILIKYSILLYFFDKSNKRKLDTIINFKNGKTNFLKVKYYPVLYHKPDIFHLQWAKGVAEWSWVQEFGIKYIVSLRGTHITISPYADEKLRQDYLHYFPKIDGFHAVSGSIKNDVLQYSINPNKIKIVYSGLDLEKLKFNLKTKFQNPIKIVSIGRNHWVKGYNFALDSFKILKDSDFKFDYKIIGIDKNAEELIFQKNQLNLNDCVSFIDKISFNKALTTISEADILLLPSIEEGIANVVLEAMALGTVVLTTDCGGMKELIIDNENGFMVSIRNPQAMADKILEISKKSNADLTIIKQNARKTIEIKHDFKKMIFDMNQLYDKVLNEK